MLPSSLLCFCVSSAADVGSGTEAIAADAEERAAAVASDTSEPLPQNVDVPGGCGHTLNEIDGFF